MQDREEHQRADHQPQRDTSVGNTEGLVPPSDIVEKVSLVKVGCSPWIGPGDSGAGRIGATAPLLRVTVTTEGRKLVFR